MENVAGLRIRGLGFGPWFCQFMVTLDKSLNLLQVPHFLKFPKMGKLLFRVVRGITRALVRDRSPCTKQALGWLAAGYGTRRDADSGGLARLISFQRRWEGGQVNGNLRQQRKVMHDHHWDSVARVSELACSWWVRAMISAGRRWAGFLVMPEESWKGSWPWLELLSPIPHFSALSASPGMFSQCGRGLPQPSPTSQAPFRFACFCWPELSRHKPRA